MSNIDYIAIKFAKFILKQGWLIDEVDGGWWKETQKDLSKTFTDEEVWNEFIELNNKNG